MIWFAAAVIIGLLSVAFIFNGIRCGFLDEVLIGAILLVVAYWCAGNAGLIQPVV